jgi:hypothetical protein
MYVASWAYPTRFAPTRDIVHDGAMNDPAWRAWAGQMATGLAVVDEDLRLRWLNPALRECLELGFRKVLGQSLGL